MAKTSRKFQFGDPEHVVDGVRARQLLANQLKFKPVGDNPSAISTGSIPRTDQGAVDFHAVLTEYNIQSTSPNGVADEMADKVISALEGNTNQFNKFTVESIAVMTNPMLDTLLRTDEITYSDDIDTIINMLPASNGKTFTSVQMLRTEEYMLNDMNFKDACQYAADETRYPKSWVKGDDIKLINPRGKADMKEYLSSDNTVFTELSESQQDAVTKIYENSPAAFDEIMDTHAAKQAEPEVKLDFDGLVRANENELPF